MLWRGVNGDDDRHDGQEPKDDVKGAGARGRVGINFGGHGVVRGLRLGNAERSG